jgi:PAS domain S-box-containing protein
MLRERLNKLTLQEKLTLLLAGTATAALVLFALATLGIETAQSRAALVRDAATQAELLAVTVAPTLAFDDPVAATETLAALRTRPEVIAAWLVPLHSTNVFARFARLDAAAAPPAPLTHVGHHFEGRWLFYHEPVSVDRGRVGTLILQADPRASNASLATYVGVVALLLALVLGLSLLLAARLQRLISAPVLDLAATARRVSESGDYSLRTAPRSPDEIGALAENMNRMLAHVQQADAALRASEERFALALRGASDGLWDWDVRTSHVFYSPRWKEMLGYRADELEHHLKTWERLTHPDDLPLTMEKVREHLAGRTGQYEVEFRMRHKEGRWVHILSRAIVVRDAAGQPVRLVGTHQDITARKHAEEQRDRFFNLSLDLLCVADLNGYFHRVNPAFTRTLGFTIEELLQQPFGELAHPEDAHKVVQAMRELRAGRAIIAVEARARCKDGSTRLIEWTCPAPPPGVTELFAVGRDVTLQRAAQLALAESEQRFRQLAETIDQVFWMVDVATEKVLYISPAYERVWGRTAAALADRPQDWIEGVHPDDRAIAEEAYRRQRETGSSDEEYRVLRPDGTVRLVRNRAFPVRDAAGRIVRRAGIIEDVTERRRLERELLEISDLEQARLGQEIHDGLCQQLVGAGFTARALEQRLNELRQAEAAQARETAELVDSAISQAYDLVGGLFPAQLDAEGLAAALREFVHRASLRSPVRFSLDYPDPIQLDPAQTTHLFRIAREAVTNALKHARPARVRVRLFERRGLVRLTVEDDGRPGADAAQPDTAGGAGGYGLRMMRYRANLLGGALEVRHPPGGGTVVTCAFRAQPPTSAPTGPTS